MNNEAIIKQLGKLSIEDRKSIFFHLKEEFAPVKKRGSKIRDAYEAITYDAENLDEFRARFNVSEIVMKQHT